MTRLHLCTISSEPSLVTYTPNIVQESREDSDKTVPVYNLPWAYSGHLYS